MLIVSCIKKKFGTKISTPDLCPLRNEGFTGFQTLLEKAFDQEAITSDDWNAILKSDDYHQLPRIQKLWNTISSSELLADRHKAQGLLDNLCKSEFNIIASYSNDVNTSIQYFLDVNLKGIRLDTEDIFKGYLFSQDSRELTRSLWQKNKRDVLRLNGVTQSSEEKRYPLMKLYEHFFYCDLYLPREGDCEYSTLKFGENFCLTSGFESGSTKYYEGSHLIEAIRDRDYLQNVLSRLNKCVEIMTDIIESEGPSTPFKDKFICAKKVDSIDIQNCHSMLKKILMEKEVIPKILALKYILTYFDGKPHAKEEYKSVYSVFCAAVLFTVFANKKESDTFYNFVRLEEWKSKINKWLYDYISSHALTRGKVLAAYKYSESDDDPIQQIRCKSLAAISNFFKVTKNGDNYNMGISNAAELCKFFGDKTVYFKIAKSAQSYFNNIMNLEGSHAAEDKNKFIQFDVYYCCALIGMAAGQIDEDTSELKDLVERYPVQYRDCKALIAGLLVASEARRLGIDTQSSKLEQIMLQYLSNNDTLLSEDGIKTLNAYALKGYRLITDYPLFDKPTSREEFLDAFNVAMQFYEKKDS